MRINKKSAIAIINAAIKHGEFELYKVGGVCDYKYSGIRFKVSGYKGKVYIHHNYTDVHFKQIGFLTTYTLAIYEDGEMIFSEPSLFPSLSFMSPLMKKWKEIVRKERDDKLRQEAKKAREIEERLESLVNNTGEMSNDKPNKEGQKVSGL